MNIERGEREDVYRREIETKKRERGRETKIKKINFKTLIFIRD